MARIRAVSPAIPNRLRRANRRGPRTARPAIRRLRLYGCMRRKRGVPAQRRNSIPVRMVISYRRFIRELHPCRSVPLAARGRLRGSPSTGEAPYRYCGHRAADPCTVHARGNLMSDSFNRCLESAGTRGATPWRHMKWHFRQNGLQGCVIGNDWCFPEVPEG